MSQNDSGRRRPGRPQNPIKREELLQVATEAFAHSGFAGTSMNDIASTVGLRKSSLFHHFDNKSQLYQEVVLGTIRQLDSLIEQIDNLEGTFRERLRELVGLIIDYIGSQPWTPVLVLREAMDEQLFAQEEGLAVVGGTLGRLVRFLRRGAEAGEFVDEDPRQLALSLVCMTLLYYGIAGVAGRFLGNDVFVEGEIELRKQAVMNQAERMCCKP
jgi:TetR/AcrR family transcriptional regulator